jgi:hypothetical protein
VAEGSFANERLRMDRGPLGFLPVLLQYPLSKPRRMAMAICMAALACSFEQIACGTMTHDYIRNGTTTLFAALNVLDGTVIGRCMQQHRHQEFIRFLNTVEAAVPAGKLIHAIADNYAAHKHPKVRVWLARHPRWTFHFTPTSASWLNAVEGFFATLTKRHRSPGCSSAGFPSQCLSRPCC